MVFLASVPGVRVFNMWCMVVGGSWCSLGCATGKWRFLFFFVIAQARLPGVVIVSARWFVFFWCAVGCAGRLWWLLVCRALGLAVGRGRLRVVVFLGRGGRCWVFGSALGIVVGAVAWFVVVGWVRRSRPAGGLGVVSLSLVCVVVVASVG